jgi:hypothetical protein
MAITKSITQSKITETNILLSTPIDNSLKKYRDHPVVRKKMDRMRELLSKVKNLHEVL